MHWPSSYYAIYWWWTACRSSPIEKKTTVFVVSREWVLFSESFWVFFTLRPIGESLWAYGILNSANGWNKPKLKLQTKLARRDNWTCVWNLLVSFKNCTYCSIGIWTRPNAASKSNVHCNRFIFQHYGHQRWFLGGDEFSWIFRHFVCKITVIYQCTSVTAFMDWY